MESPHLLCVMQVQLSAEVVLCGSATLPVVQVSILVLKVGVVVLKGWVLPSLLLH